MEEYYTAARQNIWKYLANSFIWLLMICLCLLMHHGFLTPLSEVQDLYSLTLNSQCFLAAGYCRMEANSILEAEIEGMVTGNRWAWGMKLSIGNAFIDRGYVLQVLNQSNGEVDLTLSQRIMNLKQARQ